ncbi:MAG: galactosyldiacylglycerol synthase [Aquabacterium sp.]|nr:galactosyldiacylglycerol synthase [Aquabacterium sp.]
MPTVELIYFNAGGGHRAAAQALQAVLLGQAQPWQVRCTNLVDLLDPAARFRGLTGMAPEDLYNLRLARGWTLGLATELRLLQGMIRAGHGSMVDRLVPHWRQTAPDMVVSLIPNFNRAMHDALALACPGVPLVTVMTDLADHPPAFWIEPGLANQHLVCGTAHAVQQALDAGCQPARVHRSSGMVLRPEFYQPLQIDRTAELVRLGFDVSRPVGVVMFGGQGSMEMLTIARQLPDVQLLLLCGHNATLAQRLQNLTPMAAHLVVGFTADVRRHLMLGDFFIGKPGPGSLSEALQQGLPVLTVRNAWTMPQERYNTDWVLAQGVGVVGTSWRRVRPLVDELLATLPQRRAAVARIDNRAVFELPQILNNILALAQDCGRGAVRARLERAEWSGSSSLTPEPTT